MVQSTNSLKDVSKVLDEVIEGLKTDTMAHMKAQTIINACDKQLKRTGQYLTACKMANQLPDMSQFDF
jgi:hypothetical protein